MTKKVLIIGAGGNLGRDLFRMLSNRNLNLEVAGRKEFNVFTDDIDDLRDLVSTGGYDAILNCVASIGIDNCENNRTEAFKINTYFCKVLTESVLADKTRIIHFSTDNVFSCERIDEQHSENSLTCPSTWYGITKLAGELEIAKHSNFQVIRLPLLMSSDINNQRLTINNLLKKLASGEEVIAYKDVYNTPVLIDLIEPILYNIIIKKNLKYNINHIGGSANLSIYETVHYIAKKRGMNLKKIRGVTYNESGSLVRKPRYGGLTSGHIPNVPFKESVEILLQKWKGLL